jgi:hypothetical protein
MKITGGRLTMLMNKEDSSPGGGGKPQTNDSSESDETKSDDARFVDLANKVFHKGFTEREGRLVSKITAKMEELIKNIQSKSTQESTDDDDDDDESEDDTEADKGMSPKMSPRMKAELTKLRKQVAALTESNNRATAESAAQAAKMRKVEEMNNLSSLLSPHVKPTLLNMIVQQLYHANVTRDEESGALLWKGDDGNLLPLKDGIEAWRKSEVGKEVAPPRPAAGAGSSVGGKSKGSDKFDEGDLGALLANLR